MRESSFRPAAIAPANPVHLSEESHGATDVLCAFQAPGFLSSECPLLGASPKETLGLFIALRTYY